jgi:hypothetical protein
MRGRSRVLGRGPVDVGAAIGDRRVDNRFRWGVMKRIKTAAIGLAFIGAVWLPAAGAKAQTTPSGTRTAQASPSAAAEADGQVRGRRPVRRVPIYPQTQPEPDGVYPRYFPGRNAVRDCTATYVQEYRPSGTVIVPRMNCYWRGG